MAFAMKCFKLSQIIQVCLVIWNSQCVENKIALSNGVDASFTHERLRLNSATLLETSMDDHRRLQRREAPATTEDTACTAEITNLQAQLDKNSNDVGISNLKQAIYILK